MGAYVQAVWNQQSEIELRRDHLAIHLEDPTAQRLVEGVREDEPCAQRAVVWRRDVNIQRLSSYKNSL